MLGIYKLLDLFGSYDDVVIFISVTVIVAIFFAIIWVMINHGPKGREGMKSFVLWGGIFFAIFAVIFWHCGRPTNEVSLWRSETYTVMAVAGNYVLVVDDGDTNQVFAICTPQDLVTGKKYRLSKDYQLVPAETEN